MIVECGLGTFFTFFKTPISILKFNNVAARSPGWLTIVEIYRLFNKSYGMAAFKHVLKSYV